MSSLRAVLGANPNYATPIKFKVIAVSSVRHFTDSNGIQQEIVTAAIAEGNLHMRACVYAPHIRLFAPGRLLLVKNYNIYRVAMILRNTAKVFRTGGTVEVDEATHDASYAIIHPPSSPMMLNEIHQTPLGTLVSITATLNSVSNHSKICLHIVHPF